MSWVNRLRFGVGLVVVLAVVVGLLVIVSQRTGQIVSSSAEVGSESFPVGSDYAGVMVDQFVHTGDTVKKGQRLVSVQSTDLVRDQLQGIRLKSTEVIQIVGDGLLEIKASVDGVVASMPLQSGSYVAAGATIAIIDAVGSLYVTAQYTLAPADFGRLSRGNVASIQLADAVTYRGRVDQVKVHTENGQAITLVKITSARLIYGGEGGLVAPGSPVTATIDLPGPNPLRSTLATVANWFGVQLPV